MILSKRPYLVIPKLIIQPTWGGRYILDLKNWGDYQFLKRKKIGQSYELFSQTKLLINIRDSSDKNFIPELGNPDSDEIENNNIYKENIDYITLNKVTDKINKIPLIKINQSKGNSFQIHIKKDIKNKRWQPKMESCYYLEDGAVTFGIKENTDLSEYKNACLAVEKKMKELSNDIKNKKITLEKARKASKEIIKKINPWQYVNICEVKKDTIGPGFGGVHHSWEEDRDRYPLGLVNYEVQQDVMDPVCTIRSFDKGKFKPDGSIREIHIKDYFKYLDTDPIHNDLKKMTPVRKGNRLLTTENYCLDIFEVDKEILDNTNNSFSHLFVRNGKAMIESDDGMIILNKGHSCFIPEFVESYRIRSLEKDTVLLKTFIQI